MKGGAKVVVREGSKVDCTLGNRGSWRAGRAAETAIRGGWRTRNDGVGMVDGATLSAGSAGWRGATYRCGGLRQ